MKRRVICGVLLISLGAATGSWCTLRMLSAWAAAAPVAGDVNGDGQLNLSDPVRLLNFLFQGGPPPVACPVPTLAAKTVVLVRHAEKETVGGEDAHLTAAGKVEAEKLRDVFKDVAVDFIVASTKIRTVETVEPLASRDPANPIAIEKFGDTAGYDGLIEFVTSRAPGSLTVVAHHSTTIKNICKDLGVPAEQIATINTGALNNFIVLFLQQDGPTLVLPLRGQDTSSFPVFFFGPPR